MKAQLRDASDIVGTLVMAPPVEKLLRSKEESNPEKLFNTPIGRIHVGLHVSLHFKFSKIFKNYLKGNLLHGKLSHRFAGLGPVASRTGQCQNVRRRGRATSRAAAL